MLPRIERFGILLILPALLFAQGVESSIAPTPENTSLWGLIQQGGWAMYPLGLCSLTMIFLIIHSWRLSQIREDLGGSLIPISIFVTLCRPRHAFRPR